MVSRRMSGEVDGFTVRDSVSPLVFHGGSTHSLTANTATTLLKVSDLRRYENMLAVVLGAHTGTTGTTLADANADFGTLDVRIGDVLHNVTQGTEGTISSVAVTSLEAGISFDNGDSYRIDRIGIPNAKAQYIRKFSVFTDEAIYLRYDGEASATYFDVQVNANEGYYDENIIVASHLSAIGVSATTTPTIRVTAWGA